MQGGSIDVLFAYYVEQTRHAESLRVSVAQFFAGLLSATAGACAFVVSETSGAALPVLLAAISLLGLVLSIAAAVMVSGYQRLVDEWVEKKNALEDLIYARGPKELIAVGKGVVANLRKKSSWIQPSASATFLAFGVLFAFVLTAAAGFPEALLAVLDTPDCPLSASADA